MFKSQRGLTLYIKDIFKECERIEAFVYGITYEQFTDNIEKVYAVTKTTN